MALALAAGGAWAGAAGAQGSPEEPFAVTSRGRPLPRGERTVVVVRDSAPPRPAPDSARTPARTPPRATAPPRPAGGAPAAPRTHVVAYGETFYGIANRYGITAAALRAANPGVDQERLVSGATLRIPAASTAAAPPAAAPAAGAQRSAAARRTHRVEPGESLWGIARRYEVSMEAIRRLNDLEGERVRIGQTLIIPEAD